jgi:hypothetical protein
VNRRGLLGSIVAAPVAIAHALRTSGLGRFSAGSINLGRLEADAGSVTFGKPISSKLGEGFSALDTYELGELELARYDALADEYAAINQGLGPLSTLRYPVSMFGPRTAGTIVASSPDDVWTWQAFPEPAGGRGFPDVGEL